MKFTTYSSIVTAAGLFLNAGFTNAHGYVQDLKIGNNWHKGSLPYSDPYKNPVPSRIVWPFFSKGNGPITDVSSQDITCNQLSGKGALEAEVSAGSQVTFYWDTWPESHKGPTMTYLAKCGDSSCTNVNNPSSLSYFKINEAGWDGSTWANDRLISNNNSWTVTIPSDIAPGYYILRHELLALHEGFFQGGAQFYPSCTNLKITGSGSANPQGVSFPGAYSSSDSGIYFNIYNSNLNSYVIPGPPVYSAGSGSGSGSGNSSSQPSSTSTSGSGSGSGSSTSQSSSTLASGSASGSGSSTSQPSSTSSSSSGSGSGSGSQATATVTVTATVTSTVTSAAGSCPAQSYSVEKSVKTFTFSEGGIYISNVITCDVKVSTVTVTATA